MADYRKFLGDSPDAIYHTAQLSPAYRYQITGNRGDAEYLGFMLYGRQLNGWYRAAANLSSEAIVFDDKGDFRIVLSETAPDEPGVNWFNLGDDQALVVEGTVPDSPYWGVSLQSRWMQSLDYEHYQVELNDHNIETADGRYRIVVSHRPPPSGNWLDTAGKREGLLSIRYQLSQDSEKPTLKLIKFDEL